MKRVAMWAAVSAAVGAGAALGAWVAVYLWGERYD